MTKTARFQLDPETLRLLQVIEASNDENARRVAIFELARRRTSDAARILLEIFDRTMWRQTKFTLLQALGMTQNQRATEFLCHVAMATDDLAMAAEAVLALGATDDPVAGEFLAAIAIHAEHPLVREAFIALGSLRYFPCEPEIASIVGGNKKDVPASILQNAVIAAGLGGYCTMRAPIEELLKSSKPGALFNTALISIGRIGDATSLALLERLDTRYRAFAHQLKIAAIDHLRLILGYTIEDAVAIALAANSADALGASWQLLGRFPVESAKEALQVLAGDAGVEFKTWERLTFLQKSERKADFQFLAKHMDVLPGELFAALGRKHTHGVQPKEILSEVESLGASFAVKFFGCVRVTGAIEVLRAIASDQKNELPIRMGAINALVAQPIMSGGQSEIRDMVGKYLLRMAEGDQDPVFMGRLIRGLGQIRFMGPESVNFFRERIKLGSEDQDSVYLALAMSNTDAASNLIVKRLRQIVAQPDRQVEVTRAVQSLARLDGVGDVSALSSLSPAHREELKTWILKILCNASVPEVIDIVAAGLEVNDFQTKLLAVVAAKCNHNDDIWQKVFKLLDHENVCIAGRALDTVLVAGGVREHKMMIERLAQRPDDHALYQKVFGSMTPRPGDSYADVIHVLDGLTKTRKGAMSVPDVLQAAVNLRDNLSLTHLASDVQGTPVSKGKLSEKERHAIDESLGREIRGFSKYSETIKSVLRSGEVTWQHPELFDARVDKSTVLVQYVKSIDLFLQEKIGSALFLAHGSDILQKMQSRLVRLELDDPSGFGPHLTTHLSCSLHFSPDTFPAHKLSLVCESIMSGKIMRDQYRVIDGLRSWALLLVLFGRTFNFRGQTLESLFSLAKSSNDGICRIARAMNDLQDARNRAAHRGTMLEMGNMQEMRTLCVSLLNDLDVHLLSA